MHASPHCLVESFRSVIVTLSGKGQLELTVVHLPLWSIQIHTVIFTITFHSFVFFAKIDVFQFDFYRFKFNRKPLSKISFE